MEQKAGAQISTQAFVQSLIILLVLMLAAGSLTQFVPNKSQQFGLKGIRE